jgi:hypothetical protein
MTLKVDYQELKTAIDRIFALESMLITKDFELNMLRFEVDLAKRIEEGLRALNNQMLLGG